MMRDPYANYVVQRILVMVKDWPDLHDIVMSLIKDQEEQLKKFTYGRHILSFLSK